MASASPLTTVTANQSGRLPESALVTVTRTQKYVLVGLLASIPAAALLAGWRSVGVALFALIAAFYLADLIFSTYLVSTSMRTTTPAPRTVAALDPWPTFSVLCPMYREAAILPQFVRGMTSLDYPSSSLQILLLLEEDDVETQAAVRDSRLPPQFEVVVVPDSSPKTKPKACNVGLQLAIGEYVVIYDTEDIPEPDQLKKAALTFASAPGRVACLQASLNFYNVRQNLLTRLFTAEYSLWFDLLLVGLQRFGGPIPLGGTSNHFRAHVLRGLGGWDPYNVTEDCDLGVRLYKQGFRTQMLDSTTYEEANSRLANWIRQRSRWIKGYIQTVLVHTRGGWKLNRGLDFHFLTFLAVVGGKVATNFINPVMWALTLSYFLFRDNIGTSVESLFPGPVFYAAVVALAGGNLMFIYTFLLGSASRGNWDLIKYGLLAPFYWLMMSIAAVYALAQLIRRPHYWEKTVHGLHLRGDTSAFAIEARTSHAQDWQGRS
jgi:cellulose synthase/poly-beta-1,6-N-acetylglucosamine synthase-like glycosyltransferase